MRMYDIIEKKRDGHELTDEEIAFFVKGYTAHDIPDYQAAALCMAIYFRGMTAHETTTLTLEMARSGDMIDLSAIEGVKVDKHSTGGVGDKTTLVVAPLVASLGVRVAKMSGRGLGHTGGTIDKLESIPGFKTSLAEDEFFRIVNEAGLAVAGQTANLAPADKLLYALRDVTATVGSLPLIASSIMSKKIASGANCIVLDVKYGSGAFMKTAEDACALAEAMVQIGEEAGRQTQALITSMDTPLGFGIGNSLEVIEAIQTLKGEGPKDLEAVCVELAASLVSLAHQKDIEACRALVREQIASGAGLERLKMMVSAQGGDASVIDDPSKFAVAACSREVYAKQDGFVVSMDTERCGIASMLLGAGRAQKEDEIDYTAGIVLHKKTGDLVKTGEPLATLYAASEALLAEGERALLEAYAIEASAQEAQPLFYARVTKDGIERLV